MMFTLEHPEAEMVARIIHQVTMCAWTLTLGGDSYQNKRQLFEEMKNPQSGDMVVEASGGLRQLDCAMAVGWLQRVANEPIEMEWDQEADGPVPLERVVYIRAIDGRECRWVNCSFYRVPQYPGSPNWWDIPRWKERLAAQGTEARRAETGNVD